MVIEVLMTSKSDTCVFQQQWRQKGLESTTKKYLQRDNYTIHMICFCLYTGPYIVRMGLWSSSLHFPSAEITRHAPPYPSYVIIFLKASLFFRILTKVAGTYLKTHINILRSGVTLHFLQKHFYRPKQWQHNVLFHITTIIWAISKIFESPDLGGLKVEPHTNFQPPHPNIKNRLA